MSPVRLLVRTSSTEPVEIFHADQICGDFLAENGEYPLSSVKAIITEGGYIRRVEGKRDGCVCVFKATERVDEVLIILASNGAKALIVTQEAIATARCELPVFVVTDDVMLRLSEIESGTVRVEVQGSDGANISQGSISPPRNSGLAMPVSPEEISDDVVPSGASDDLDTPAAGSAVAWQACEATASRKQSFDEMDVGMPHEPVGRYSPPPAPEGTISLRYRLTVVAADDPERTIGNFAVVAVDDGAPLADSQFHAAASIKVFRESRTRNISSFIDDAKGKVCVCQLENVADVNVFQRIAAEQGAKAVLFVHKPTESCHLPVFVVPRGAMDKIAKLDLADVRFRFQRQDSSQLSSFLRQDRDLIHEADVEDHHSEAPASRWGALHGCSELSEEWETFGEDDGIDTTAQLGFREVEEKARNEDAESSRTSSLLPSRETTITAGYTLVVSSVSGFGSEEHFGVEAVEGCPPMDEQNHPIASIALHRDPLRDQIPLFKPSDDLHGKVCLCSLVSPTGVNFIIGVAAAKGAKALLVLQKPTASSSLPVFIVSNGLVEKMSSLDFSSTQVCFRKNDSSRGDRNTSPLWSEVAAAPVGTTSHFGYPSSTSRGPGPAMSSLNDTRKRTGYGNAKGGA
jgi:hypothetical protein